MSEAQRMEEELQLSVRVAESVDAEGDEEMPHADMTMDNGATYEENHINEGTMDGEEMEGEEDQSEQEDGGEEEQDSEDGSEDEDAEHEDFDEDAEHEEFDEDAEHEEDDLDPLTVPDRKFRTHSRDLIHEDDEDDEDDDEEDEEDGEAEAVGAVKLKPGETDDEEESDGASSHSGGHSDEDESGSEAEWEALQPEKENDEDDESEAAENDLCMFCKEDEQHDPAEEFEAYLTCSSCGENGRLSMTALLTASCLVTDRLSAHQQCAREENALQSPPEGVFAVISPFSSLSTNGV
jgi:histone acetyltransferase SAS3